jgi:hypothetical protein
VKWIGINNLGCTWEPKEHFVGADAEEKLKEYIHSREVEAEKAPASFNKAELWALVNEAHLDAVYESQYVSTQIAVAPTEVKVDDFDIDSLA